MIDIWEKFPTLEINLTKTTEFAGGLLQVQGDIKFSEFNGVFASNFKCDFIDFSESIKKTRQE